MAQFKAPARKVVLVVEDEPILRMMATDLVEEAGFDAVEARSADEAMDVLENRPDVRIVFTDVDMPGSIDGLTLAAAVALRWPAIEIIITSGHRKLDRATIPAGSEFFSKPYDTQKVTSMLLRMATRS